MQHRIRELYLPLLKDRKTMLSSFLNLLQGCSAERTVWTADLTYWMAGQEAAGTADPKWKTEQGYLCLHQELGVMPYYYYDKFWVAMPVYSPPIRLLQEQRGHEVIKQIVSLHGILTEITRFLPTSCSTGCSKHYVESEEDLDLLVDILEHRRLLPINLDDYADRMAMWGEYGGIPSIGLPRTPLADLLTDWVGIENMSYLLADCESKIKRVLDLLFEQEKPIIEAVCTLRPPLVHFPDNLSSDNLTSFYDRYMRDHHKQRLERLHDAGIKAAVHLDGTVAGLLPKLVAVGFDAIEAITPQPAGDLSLAEIDRLAGNEPVILWGGVPGVLFAPPYSWRDMASHIDKVLACWGDRPFVLGVADQVPPDGDIRFCRQISERVAQKNSAARQRFVKK